MHKMKKKESNNVAVLELKYGEDEILKTVCEEIREINDEIKQFSDDMLDTMYKYDGIGLAACQVGKTIRMITYDVSYIEEGAKKKPMVLINPKIIWKSKTLVKVEDIGLDGKKRIISAKNLEAVVLQHEIDHLEGIVFLDKLGISRSTKAKKKK